MSVSIRLYNIQSPHDFKVEYTFSGYTNPYTLVGAYSASTTTVVISGVNYNTVYYVKITDLISGQYSIQPISITDPNCYNCYTGTSSYCYELDTTGGGNYNFSYNDVYGIPKTGTSNNEIINFCAQDGSVTYTGTGSVNLTNSFSPCSSDYDCYPTFIVTGLSIDQFVFSTLRSSIPFRVEWGDGSYTDYPANWNGSININGGPNFSTGHTYSSLFTGLIKVKSNDLSKISIIRTDDRPGMLTSGTAIFDTSELSKLSNLDQFYGINTELYGNVSDLPRTLTRLTSYLGQLSGGTEMLPTGLTLLNLPFYERNVLSGNTIDLPRTLTTILCYGFNTITGYVSDLPTGLTRLDLTGYNTISGSTSDLNPPIGRFLVWGNSVIYGDIADIPLTVYSFRVAGYNYVYGDLQSLSGHSLIQFSLQNNNDSTTGNTVTGDIKYIYKGCEYILIQDYNTIYGNLLNIPTGGTINGLYFNITGQNTLEGDISSFKDLANNVNLIWIGGNNTISGNTNSLPTTLTVFNLDGNNTLTGNLSDIPVGCFYIDINGNNTVNEYSGKTWVNDMNRLKIGSVSNFSNSAIDWILQDVSGYTWSYSNRFLSNPTITLNGTGTTASNLAVVKLTSAPPTGYGVTLTLNP